MTVLDTSVVIDFLLGEESAHAVARILEKEGFAAAPDLLVYEVLAVLRRQVTLGALTPRRAAAAVADLGDLTLELFPTLPLRHRAWELRDNLTAADALFVALAERLGEPLVTKDRGLVAAARAHTAIDVVELPA